ncbi:hypothetical protein [Pseudomonas purpurea]|uniref:hypothetical protein n=1 Tax=Pseudomonas purpurea TaxID=3136737 RepID=UPI003264D3AF
MSIEATQQIFVDYHRFDDGLLLSFEYFYAPGERLAAKLVLHARNHTVEGNEWRTVEVVVTDVKELCAKVRGDQFHSICSGVKLLNLDGLWCVDVDGVYSFDEDPVSLDEVRRDGSCYVIGSQVEACEIEG